MCALSTGPPVRPRARCCAWPHRPLHASTPQPQRLGVTASPAGHSSVLESQDVACRGGPAALESRAIGVASAQNPAAVPEPGGPRTLRAPRRSLREPGAGQRARAGALVPRLARKLVAALPAYSATQHASGAWALAVLRAHPGQPALQVGAARPAPPALGRRPRLTSCSACAALCRSRVAAGRGAGAGCRGGAGCSGSAGRACARDQRLSSGAGPRRRWRARWRAAWPRPPRPPRRPGRPRRRRPARLPRTAGSPAARPPRPWSRGWTPRRRRGRGRGRLRASRRARTRCCARGWRLRRARRPAPRRRPCRTWSRRCAYGAPARRPRLSYLSEQLSGLVQGRALRQCR